jgi:hypothetical protein
VNASETVTAIPRETLTLGRGESRHCGTPLVGTPSTASPPIQADALSRVLPPLLSVLQVTASPAAVAAAPSHPHGETGRVLLVAAYARHKFECAFFTLPSWSTHSVFGSPGLHGACDTTTCSPHPIAWPPSRGRSARQSGCSSAAALEVVVVVVASVVAIVTLPLMATENSRYPIVGMRAGSHSTSVASLLTMWLAALAIVSTVPPPLLLDVSVRAAVASSSLAIEAAANVIGRSAMHDLPPLHADGSWVLSRMISGVWRLGVTRETKTLRSGSISAVVVTIRPPDAASVALTRGV